MFELNRKPFSALVCDGRSCQAFSGAGKEVDDPGAVADKNAGPLPPGTYYIVARDSGGRLGRLYDWVHSTINGYDVTKWFMLWRDSDGKVEDKTLVDGVMRGQFACIQSGLLESTKAASLWPMRMLSRN